MRTAGRFLTFGTAQSVNWAWTGS